MRWPECQFGSSHRGGQAFFASILCSSNDPNRQAQCLLPRTKKRAGFRRPSRDPTNSLVAATLSSPRHASQTAAVSRDTSPGSLQMPSGNPGSRSTPSHLGIQQTLRG